MAGIAVYCGSSRGTQEAYIKAAQSVGRALAKADYRLVFGGGTEGLMGAVSQAAYEAGGKVTGIVPYVMVAAGGERDKTKPTSRDPVVLPPNTDKYESIVVDSMHERKVEMAKRSQGFVALPGGFGTFEEILEVTTWTQLGIHVKPVIILNVLNFWEPLRQLISSAIEAGFIHKRNQNLIIFVDGPSSLSEHENFDWGKAAVEAIEAWNGTEVIPLFDMSVQRGGKTGSLETAT